jgi:hypothetical protein
MHLVKGGGGGFAISEHADPLFNFDQATIGGSLGNRSNLFRSILTPPQ